MRRLFVFLLCVLLATPGRAASLINDTEIERYLIELVTPIATAADIPAKRLRVHIVRDDDFNAFVMGGDDVYIYTGLLMQIKNPDALQAVVAHELGHTIGGHMAQMSSRMTAEMRRAMLIQALGIGLMVAGGNPSLGAGVVAGSSGIASQSMMAFSRDEERIADNLGLDLMVRAGQNPNGFITVFEQMQEQTGVMESRINPTRVNHPLTTERLKNVRDRIAKMNYTAPPKNATRDKRDAAVYARAIAAMQTGDLAAAKSETQRLISRDGSNPYFYELLGDIQYQFGHYDDSVVAYEKSLKLAGNAPQIQTALALVLTERNKPGDRTRAIELCKRAILAEAAPLTYWVLARAYGDDDSGRAAWATAEYYNMIGDKKNARKYAKIAQKKLKSDDAEYIKSGDILSSTK